MSHASRIADQLRIAADEDALDDDTREQARQAVADFEDRVGDDPLADAEEHGGYWGFEVPDDYGGESDA